VNPLVAQRQLALAGVALLAGLAALAVTSRRGESSPPSLPASIPAPGGGWFQAIATANGATFSRRHRDPACGHLVGPTSLGVASPVLPCDAKLYISYRGREALTEVIARGPSSPQANLEVTPALAAKLGLTGTRPLSWRYAR
jgi:hypothetical protein